jgi:hypothetical protein
MNVCYVARMFLWHSRSWKVFFVHEIPLPLKRAINDRCCCQREWEREREREKKRERERERIQRQQQSHQTVIPSQQWQCETAYCCCMGLFYSILLSVGSHCHCTYANRQQQRFLSFPGSSGNFYWAILVCRALPKYVLFVSASDRGSTRIQDVQASVVNLYTFYSLWKVIIVVAS